MPFIPAPCSPPCTGNPYAYEVLSEKQWEPIFDIRARTPWVQVVAFDLFKQLTPMRYMPCNLPPFETINVPLEHQARVEYGDLLGLCDTIEYVYQVHGHLGAAYGGPDDKGTLWIKFYQLEPGMQSSTRHLEFIIWIDSLKPSVQANSIPHATGNHGMSGRKPTDNVSHESDSMEFSTRDQSICAYNISLLTNSKSDFEGTVMSRYNDLRQDAATLSHNALTRMKRIFSIQWAGTESR
ncbi:hypothetical protein BDR22DRAFT_965756 [Usnea florida]